MSLEGKVIAVVGASSGIGEGISRAIAEKHPKTLIIAARRKNLLDELSKELSESYGIDIHSAQLDIGIDSELESFMQNSIKKFGRIDALVNSAGVIQKETPIYEQKLSEIESVTRINQIQAIKLASIYSREMIKQKHGVYLVISSQAGEFPFSGEAAYNGSKAGINHAIRSIDLDLKKIREEGQELYAFSLGPGFINTKEAKRQFPEIAEQIEKAISPIDFGKIVCEYIIIPGKKYDENKGPVKTIETLRI